MINRMGLPLFIIAVIFFQSIGLGQIQVHEEPLHHPVQTNNHWRVLDVVANPGDTSKVHQHRNNYCYVTVAGGRIWVKDRDEDGRVLNLPVGFTGGYFENPDTPLVHQFANIDNQLIRLIAIENLSMYGDPIEGVIRPGGKEELLIENAWFRITKLILQPNERLDTRYPYPTVLVSPNQFRPVFTNGFTDGLSVWKTINANRKTKLRNTLADPMEVVIVVVKDK